MCGLVGIAGNLNITSYSKVFRDLLIFDTTRGMDSTGVLHVSAYTNNIILEKEIGGPTNLFELKSKIFDRKGLVNFLGKVLIGHNRAATLGSVSVDNAHPFEFGDIIGTHNGTLSDWSELDGYKENDVDSKSVFQTIANKGIEHTWKSFIGAAALVWWNKKDNTLNFIRNDGRPLYVCSNDKKDVLIWASERWMIEIAAIKNGIALDTIEVEGVKKNNIWQFKSDWWHSYKITSTGYSLEVSKELEKKPEPVTKITSNYGATTVGNNYGYYRGHDAYYKVQKNFDKKVLDKKTKINLGWIANKEKAPKEVRGSLIKLSYAIDDTADNKSGFYYIVAYTIPNPESITPVQKDRVVIYPSTYGEFLYWKQRLDYGSKEALYKLRARPRVQKSSSGLFVEYCISAENVILNNSKLDEDQYSIPFDDDEEDENNVTKIYPGPDGKLLTEKDWYKAASTITFSGCCSNCDSWLEPKDAEEIYWDQHLAICPRCLEDPYIEDFLQMRTRKAKGA